MEPLTPKLVLWAKSEKEIGQEEVITEAQEGRQKLVSEDVAT